MINQFACSTNDSRVWNENRMINLLILLSQHQYILLFKLIVYIHTHIIVILPMAAINAFAEVHGPQSKCVEFRIDTKWAYANSTVPPIIGGACYEVNL